MLKHLYRLIFATFFCFSLIGISNALDEIADPDEILMKSDLARGGGLPGLVWSIDVEDVNGKKVSLQSMTVKADNDNSLVEFTSPSNISDQRLLVSGRNMWFIRKGLRRPVPISPRQRLIGQVSNGDVAATNYAGDYKSKLLGEEEVSNEKCFKLELTARDNEVTYPKIVYWISKQKGLGVKAEFYTLSDRVFKVANFRYENSINYLGKNFPFVSQMIIEDKINPNQRTLLKYSDARVVELSRKTFDLNYILR